MKQSIHIMRILMTNLTLGLICLSFAAGEARAQFPTYQVVGQYTDRENEVTVDLYMETLEKFQSILSADPLSATDPERIVADSMNLSAPREDRTFLMVSGITLDRCEGPAPCFFESTIDVLPLVQGGLIIFDVPYIVLAVYSDHVPRAPAPGEPEEIVYYGTHSPGVFIFDEDDFRTDTTGLQIEAAVDPLTERPVGEVPGSMEEMVDLLWKANNFVAGSTITLYFDRDNTYQLRDEQGDLIATVTGSESRSLNQNEFFANNGTEGIDYGTINLTVDSRFPPPPPTGSIDASSYPNSLESFNDPFVWDFSAVPQGRYYIYGFLNNNGKEQIVDYSTYALQIGSSDAGDIPRWPFLIGDAVDDRFVQGVAINDVVPSATNLDVVAVAQSGLFRVLDHLGRSWPPYEIDLDVTIDTAPSVTDIDGDDDLEIILGTNALSSDDNPIFAEHNAILSIDPTFKPAYEQMLSAVRAGTYSVQEALEEFGLVNDIYFIPAGHRVFSTPFVQDQGNEGAHEVVYVSRPTTSSGSSIIEAVIFSDLEDVAPQAVASITPSGVGVLGTPAVGNVDSDPEPEIVVGSSTGKVYVFELQSGSIGTPIFQINDVALQSESLLRAPALADIDGDGEMEIFIAISERDRDLPGRTQLHLMHGDGTSAIPGADPSNTLLYEPAQEFGSLSTPVVARLGTTPDFPLAVLFATEGAFVGIDVTRGPDTVLLFEENFQGTNRAFAASSPIVGQTHPGNDAYEIVMGGGSGTNGNLFGVSYDPVAGELVPLSGFDTHQEPILPGRARPASILGSPEMADLDGNQKTDVVYTNEEGYIDRFEAPNAFVEPLIPADFPWPFFKHDHNRSGALGEPPVPVAPFKPGDINRDGVVDENDLFDMALRWSRTRSFPTTTDSVGGKVADDDRKTPQRMLLRVLSNLRIEED
ncbi:MAG: hypothetical protein H6752_03695 [Candidatus Omnitrophica bacterium]|nr:hypothetical protein [Candidatus Omnitrophota bacterium]